MIENPWDAIRQALAEARALDRAASDMADSMADLLAGRLRQVSPHRLQRLKRELTAFNMHTRKWRSS